MWWCELQGGYHHPCDDLRPKQCRLLNVHYLRRKENPDSTRAATSGWLGFEQMVQIRLLARQELYGSKHERRLLDLLANINLMLPILGIKYILCQD